MEIHFVRVGNRVISKGDITYAVFEDGIVYILLRESDFVEVVPGVAQKEFDRFAAQLTGAGQPEDS